MPGENVGNAAKEEVSGAAVLMGLNVIDRSMVARARMYKVRAGKRPAIFGNALQFDLHDFKRCGQRNVYLCDMLRTFDGNRFSGSGVPGK